jgi:preprotein translocase subunit SecE
VDDVAKRDRRAGDPADELRDEPLEAAADDDLDRPRGGTALQERPRRGRSRFGFGRIGRFIREVVAELRKVNWPTRKELVTYAVVVVFFIAVMMAIIAGFDYGFASAVQWIFGG